MTNLEQLEDLEIQHAKELKEARQAGIDEAVEIVESKRKTYEGATIYNGASIRIKVDGYNQALDDIIKALQDNK